MKLIFLTFTLFISSLLVAQTDTVKSKTYTVTYSGKANPYKKTEYNKLIKINPVLFLAGDIPIYFETKLSKEFTVEAGVGITYYDFLSSGYSLFEEAEDYSNFDIYPDYGYSLRGNIRYYPSYLFDEWYFGMGFQFKRYNALLEDKVTKEQYDERKKITDARLVVGYVTYMSDRVFADIYGTLGFRYKSVSNHNGVNLYRMPAFSIGIKLGFAL